MVIGMLSQRNPGASLEMKSFGKKNLVKSYSIRPSVVGEQAGFSRIMLTKKEMSLFGVIVPELLSGKPSSPASDGSRHVVGAAAFPVTPCRPRRLHL